MIRKALAKQIDALTAEGGILRVRGLMALMVTAGAVWLTIDGTLSAATFVGVWASIVGTYFGARISQTSDSKGSGSLDSGEA